MSDVTMQTVDDLLQSAAYRKSFQYIQGDTYRDLSTIIIKAIPGDVRETRTIHCDCGKDHEVETSRFLGLHPVIVESWNRLIKPMNVPVLELVVSGHEVGVAYTMALEQILGNPALAKFKYLLTMEYDNVVPYIPDTQGPLMMLYEDIAKGYDVVGGLYFTKGSYSLPLVYGDPSEGREAAAGMFKVRYDWAPGDLVECNGMGMGFTLFKLDIFKDPRIEKPWFRTVQEHASDGIKQYTQDLWFFEQARKAGYRCAVDTRVQVGHMDLHSGRIY